jgi:arylsulfatase A-like enzyme/predicted dienelactone hydrolase
MTLSRRTYLRVAVLVMLLGVAPGVRSAAQPTPTTTPSPAARRPNILVIVADDLGYGDLGIHGSPDLKTPNLDALARGGVRCTNGYASCPVCAPTRAGIMTGRYQQRFGLEFNPGPGTTAGEPGLPLTEITLAEALRDRGYATGMVGKWHLGGAKGLRPPERGFQEFFGFLEGAHSYVPPTDPALVADARPVIPFQRAIWRGLAPVREDEYLTDAFTREALAFIDTPRGEGRPFFLYLTYNAVHSPLQAHPGNLDRVGVAGIGPPRRQLYASMLAALDDGIGRILARLRERQLDRDTLVFFVSDNGGAPQPYNTTDNTPFSGKKGELLEGGIHIPYFVRWTGILPEGSVYTRPVISLDIFATALAAAGGELPRDRTYDGVNLVPFLNGKDPAPPHDALYWRYGEALAIRQGPWKLHKTGKYPGQLYDLESDVGETIDVSRRHPDLVRDLESALARWNAGLREPLWPTMPPHERSYDWLYEVQQDPRLLARSTATATAAAPAPRYDPLEVAKDAGEPSTRELTIHDEARDRDIPVRVYLPRGAGPAPVVLFSHGLGGTRGGSSFLGRHWAARGYVAVFLQHPGSDDSVWKDLPPAERAAAMRRAAGAENFRLRVQDVPAVLDRLDRWNRESGHALEGRLQLAQVGMAGHSFGAVTTQAVSGQSYPLPGGVRRFTDPRIKAALVLSPSRPAVGDAGKAFADVTIPWMLMTGTRDVARIGGAPIGAADVASRLAVFPALPPGDKYELVLDGAEHSAFTDRELPGETGGRNPNHHRVILALSTAFWDSYLLGRAEAREWLAGEGARGVMEAGDGWQKK